MQFDDQIQPSAASISGLLERIAAFLEGHGVEPRAIHDVALVVEEILANVAMHGGGEKNHADIRIVLEPDRVNGQIVDTGRAFDPTTAPEPDIGLDIADRQVGGLGLYLVRRVTSSFSYQRIEGRNHTIFSVPRTHPSA